MTGFGEGSAENERLEVAATLRTVNHRFLDLSVRMPEEYRALEPELAQRIRDALARGRVELRLSVRPLGRREVEINVDDEIAARYVEASNRLAEREGVSRSLSSGDLLRLPEVISVQAGTGAITEADKETVGRAVDQALVHLLATRSCEGADLAEVLGRILVELGEVVSELSESSSQLQGVLYEKTRRRIEELTADVSLDEARLAQEIALLVDRADVREEIDRLNVHVDRFRSLLEVEDPVGKQLDFLAQEILRELNTVGSKCRNSEAIQLVLDGKVRCEQLREQVQNVE